MTKNSRLKAQVTRSRPWITLTLGLSLLQLPIASLALADDAEGSADSQPDVVETQEHTTAGGRDWKGWRLSLGGAVDNTFTNNNTTQLTVSPGLRKQKLRLEPSGKIREHDVRIQGDLLLGLQEQGAAKAGIGGSIHGSTTILPGISTRNACPRGMLTCVGAYLLTTGELDARGHLNGVVPARAAASVGVEVGALTGDVDRAMTAMLGVTLEGRGVADGQGDKGGRWEPLVGLRPRYALSGDIVLKGKAAFAPVSTDGGRTWEGDVGGDVRFGRNTFTGSVSVRNFKPGDPGGVRYWDLDGNPIGNHPDLSSKTEVLVKGAWLY